MDIYQLIQDGKISRYFRARKKLVHAGLVSHITQRAAGSDILFLDDDDYRSMLALMKELCKKYGMTVYAFCLLPNHIHLLLNPSQNNLHMFLRDLFGRYAVRFNKRYERKGHLFGGPFRQSVILSEGYLLAVSLYIHLNPVRAALVSDPRQYRFSSCRLYTEKKAPESFVDPKLVLSLLANKEEVRPLLYTELLNRGKGVDTGNVLEDEQATERFMFFLKKSFPAFLSKSDKNERGQALLPSSSEVPDEQIADFESLRGLRKPESMKAKRYLVEQLLARGYTMTQVAERLEISRKTVYNILTYRL
jgi:putative transposase